MATPDLCVPCKSTGLAMHIALALPAPQGAGTPALPGWAPAAKVAPVPMAGYDYALRTVRAGYLYVFFEKNRTGSNKWQSWEISASGTLYPLKSPEWVIPLASKTCSRSGHSPARLHFIVIENPDQCKTSWMAFSEHQWSKETLKRYAGDKTLRSQRMLRFEPAALIASDNPGGECMTAGSQAALEAICDYAPGFVFSKLPFEEPATRIKPISTGEDGKFAQAALESFHSTRYPWADGRTGTADKAAEMLKLRSKKKDGSAHPGVVVALPDAIGCAHEMNGYRNDVAGCIARYGDERGMQITAVNILDGLEQALKQKALDEIEQPWQWTAQDSATRLKGVKPSASAEDKALEQDLCARWERDAAARVPQSMAQQRSINLARGRSAYGADQVRIDKSIAVRQKTIANNPQISKERHASADQSAKADYAKCMQRIDPKARDAFKNNWMAFLAAADKTIDKRTIELNKWLDAAALQTALDDFHPVNVADGAAFEAVVAKIIMGISSSAAGGKKINDWVKEAQAKPGNLLWRAVALNQTDIIEALNDIMAQAKQQVDTPLSETAVLAAQGTTKHLAKFSDLIKKALSLHNTLRKDGVIRVPTGGLEKILMAVGERFFQPFVKKGVDTLAEKWVQSLLLLRTGADYTHTMALVMAEAKFGKIGRTETLMLMSMGQAIAGQQTSQGFNALKQAWKDLAGAADTPKANSNPALAGGFNEARDLRFAMVATLLQGLFAWKLSQDAANDPNNQKLQGQLFAAQLSFGAGVIDLGATSIKGLNAVGDKALSFQGLKIAGGVLSAGAGVIAGQLDFEEAEKAKLKNNYALARLYRLKGYANFAGAGFSALATLSYAQPAMGMIEKRFVTSAVARGLSYGAARLVAARAILMLGGMGFSLAVLAIQGIVWVFSDSELQIWCEQCAFGNERQKKSYSTPEIQMQRLGEALQEVM
jgi:hypothetical protein